MPPPPAHTPLSLPLPCAHAAAACHRAQLTFKACLESTEYTSRRNALSVLKRLIPVFPVVDTHVRTLSASLKKVRACK